LADQDVNCNYLEQHVIIYNERNKSVNYPDTWENKFSIIELCKVRIYGKYTYLSVVFKYGQLAYSDSYLDISSSSVLCPELPVFDRPFSFL
jgi:hypothetical protein